MFDVARVVAGVVKGVASVSLPCEVRLLQQRRHQDSIKAVDQPSQRETRQAFSTGHGQRRYDTFQRVIFFLLNVI